MVKALVIVLFCVLLTVADGAARPTRPRPRTKRSAQDKVTLVKHISIKLVATMTDMLMCLPDGWHDGSAQRVHNDIQQCSGSACAEHCRANHDGSSFTALT
jgi:hypothetical protein